jgi:hypothetical protein
MSSQARIAAILRRDWSAAGEPAETNDALVEGACAHGVAPLVYRAFSDAGRLEALSPGVRRRFRAVASHAVLVESIRDADLRLTLGALAERGIEPLVFKGTALAHTHYVQPWLRTRGDTDLLVPAGRTAETCEVLEGLGFVRLNRPMGHRVTHQCRYAAVRQGVEIAYDVHWKIADPHAFADLFSYAELRAEAVRLPGHDVHVPSPVHALLVACIHRVAHHYDTDALFLLCDLDLLARRLTDAEWKRVEILAGEKQVRAVCARSLQRARGQLGTPVPAWVGPASAGGLAAGEPTVRFLAPGLRRVDMLASDLRALDTWGARVQLIRQHVFPSPGYLLGRLPSRSRLWVPLLPALYVHRAIRGFAAWMRPLNGHR